MSKCCLNINFITGKDRVMPNYIIRPGVQIVEPERKFVAPLTNPECRSVYLAGLKGTSLALLNSIETDKVIYSHVLL